MIKVPSKNKKHLISEIKKFRPIVNGLLARGKESSEDDARIILNDILHDALGFDKYTELKTEHREKNNRLDYAIKLTEGKNKNKADVFDFLIEAKAAHVELNNNHTDQTLSYCLGLNLRFFVVTNSKEWRLFYVNKRKKKPESELVFSFSFNDNISDEDMADSLYIFSRDCYLSGKWKELRDKKDALGAENIMAILLSDKVTRVVGKELKRITGLKLDSEIIKSVIEKEIGGGEVQSINKRLLRKLDNNGKRERQTTNLPPSLDSIVNQNKINEAEIEEESNDDTQPDINDKMAA